ncbi:MAG: hypothetical protein ACPL0B_00880 [Anaerolineales bacterium]
MIRRMISQTSSWCKMGKIGRFIPSPRHSFWLIYLLTAIFSLGIYVLMSAKYYRMGYPLDDAWIHQTYARNLAHGLGWTFIPGKTSGGSTSPLWTMLLSIGYYFHLAPLLWSSLLGGGLLIGIIHLIRLSLDKVSLMLDMGWVPYLFFFEWHFVWAALSGMETILSIFLVTFLFYWLKRDLDRGWRYGLFLGVCVWVRPDLISLVIPILVKMVFTSLQQPEKKKILSVLLLNGIGMAFTLMFLLGMYVLFNYETSGYWLPTTFYAKQAEYESLLSHPLWQRFYDLFKLTWVGVGILLLPAYLYRCWRAFMNFEAVTISFFVWVSLYIGIYALRLPVTYQHGRYIQPVLAVNFLLGLEGVILWWKKNKNPSKRIWAMSTIWKWAFVLTGIAFYGLGVIAYAKDVAFIESQMVDTAVWVNTNIPPSSKIAVHDIGAMEYFGKRYLVDLAGLIDPNVIPIIRNEERLAEYMDLQKVDVLVCFPGWYPWLTADQIILHQADGRLNGEYELGVMTVYQWSLRKLASR